MHIRVSMHLFQGQTRFFWLYKGFFYKGILGGSQGVTKV